MGELFVQESAIATEKATNEQSEHRKAENE